MQDFAPSTVPGCHVPHLWLQGRRSLYDALGPGYTLIRLNREGGQRRTHFSLKHDELMWVDERAGFPCYECGTTIEQGWHPGDDIRKSWYCPKCQGVDRTTLARPAPTPRFPRRHAPLR